MKQALVKYDGTLILVSHDRDFLDGLVDTVYEFKDGRIKEHLGGISAFLERRKIENLTDLEKKYAPEEKVVPVSSRKEGETPSKLSYEEQKELRKRQKQVENCEKKIKELEEKMKGIEEKLASPEEGTDIDSLTRSYLEYKRELDLKMDEWLLLSE